MVITALQLLPPILGLPATARNGYAVRRPRMMTVTCCRHNQATTVHESRLTSSLSRRDALSYMSSAFIATLLVAGPAEARTSRQENKRKVREKLEKLREKALGPDDKNGAIRKKESLANLLIPPKLVEATI
ncbi:unknown protein [Oryza sativa Japonica Group]|jgi:hypothetical protein|uniref:Os01g0644000 protein n=5 Tax=Oryza TaxID=4527 RepID=A0A0P0V5T9_ORYSJ|nr:uncharacterized protein LOC4326569 [Oryza sativa Japonica Group]EEC71174.1 hypothetical protein OsI_03044 [Oryza sativa Indica Group]KAB8082658.1 hypothetical protein EE612_004630 [Oryza sativa]EEE55073.1 hypothetical protein OsJ_02797 [Oryza sativa Japonica Group]KAF2951397.1 hypothetical protein DAI22_01g258800 [Oryza sativa Japonica Group]BAD68000.1 unknown protein [Oryza sativa Japonica Group]|eukprot:NP_001043696.1 Os01g0644000 [Oryza sativa Japonica Group]